MNRTRNSHRARGAFAALLALIFLAVMVSLAMVYASANSLSLRTSDNYGQAAEARHAAEGGLAFVLYHLQAVRLPGTTDANSFPTHLATELGGLLDGTANLSGQTVAVSGPAVTVPPIALPYGQFASSLAWSEPNRAALTVTGEAGRATRRVQIMLDVVSRPPAVFDYGLASRGQIAITGNAEIVGVNDPSEASVLSTTTSDPNAIVLDGHAVVSGDLYASADGASISISGSPTVAGETDPNLIAAHVHLGATTPDFPTVDTAPLAALATNVLTDSSPSDPSYSNIRIAANTNPTFGGDVVVNGVVYVEAPNIVGFEGHTTINGLIVTEDADLPVSSCRISFSSNVQANGVEALPDSPEFADVKTQTGTFLLAPGFGVSFSGNFGAVVGTIAAEQMTFAGTAEGLVRGTVLCLGDLPSTLSGNVQISVDRAGAEANPAGFVPSLALEPVAETYRELAGP